MNDASGARTVTVEPAEFAYVRFDSGRIAALVDRLAGEAGLDPAVPVTLTVDETTPLGFTELLGVEPVTMRCGSGALEDPKRLREMSVDSSVRSLGRLLYEAADRRRDGFGAPVLGTAVPLGIRSAWDAWTMGRLARSGHQVQQQRQRYSFRVRHGFSDAVDAVFDQLFTSAEPFTYARLGELSGSVDPSG